MKGKRIWFKADVIRQLSHKGQTCFMWITNDYKHSLGLGLPANEVEIIATWRVSYKTFTQAIVFKLMKLFKR